MAEKTCREFEDIRKALHDGVYSGKQVDAIFNALATAEQERDALKQQLQHAIIDRDVKFWREYADETCKNLAESNGKLTRLLGETGLDRDRLLEAAKTLVAEIADAYKDGDYKRCLEETCGCESSTPLWELKAAIGGR